MPGVRIRVTSGPDEGLEVALCAAEARIGRGAAANVRIDDQGMNGLLRVRLVGGVYQVANEVTDTVGRPAAVTVVVPDGGPEYEFPPDTETVWYAGHQIRLTTDTSLLLTADPDLDLPDGRIDTSRGKTGARAKRERDLTYIVLIVLLFGAAAVLFTLDSEDAPAADMDVSGRYRSVEEGLREARTDPRAARAADAVLRQLRDARFAEASGRRAEAADRYAAAREELNRVLGPGDGPPPNLPEASAAPFRTAREFVAGRLVALSSFLGKDRAVR